MKIKKYILFLSLFFNFLFSGLIVGYFYNYYQSSCEKKMLATIELFQPEFKDMFIETMQQVKKEGALMKRTIQEKRKVIYKIIESESFNEDLFLQRVGEIQDYRKGQILKIAGLIQHMTKNMPHDQRKILAQFFSHLPCRPYFKRNLNK